MSHRVTPSSHSHRRIGKGKKDHEIDFVAISAHGMEEKLEIPLTVIEKLNYIPYEEDKMLNDVFDEIEDSITADNFEEWMDPQEDIRILSNFKKELEKSIIFKKSPLYKRQMRKLDASIKMFERFKKKLEREGVI